MLLLRRFRFLSFCRRQESECVTSLLFSFPLPRVSNLSSLYIGTRPPAYRLLTLRLAVARSSGHNAVLPLSTRTSCGFDSPPHSDRNAHEGTGGRERIERPHFTCHSWWASAELRTVLPSGCVSFSMCLYVYVSTGVLFHSEPRLFLCVSACVRLERALENRTCSHAYAHHSVCRAQYWKSLWRWSPDRIYFFSFSGVFDRRRV